MKRRLANASMPAFRKMRLVPVDEADKDVLEQRIRNYDPVVSTMAGLLPEILKPKLNRKAPTMSLAIHNASLQRYKSLERQRNDGFRAPSQPSEPAAAPEERVVPLPSVDVPRMYKPRLDRLLEHLEKHPGAIGRTRADELVIDGSVQRGTTFSGAMRSLYVNTNTPAPGTRQLATKLRQLDVPSKMLSSKYALSLFKQHGSGIKWPGKRGGRILHVYK